MQADLFQAWLMEMDDAIDAFKQTLPPAIAAQLDFSADSLDVVERLALDTWASVEETRPSSQARALDAMARYVGEVFRKHLGGRWKIDHLDKKNAFHGLPQLTGMRAQEVQFCPLTFVTASTHRRTGHFFRKIFDNNAGKPA